MCCAVVIKAEITTANEIENLGGNPFIFPDEDDVDLINDTFNGPDAQILIPNELLHQALHATSNTSFID